MEPQLVLRFFTPSIFGSHVKVMKCLIPKHLEDSWNLRDVFINMIIGSQSFPISFSENRWQGANNSLR